MSKALDLGVRQALADLPGRGRPPAISAAARAWVVALACQKPKDLGYAQELWTTRLLAQHIRKHAEAAGQPSLRKLGRGTVSKILSTNQVRPHKIPYYLERRHPEFDAKMVQVLHIYKEVEIWRKKGAPPPDLVAVLSYDEKPAIQAIENTAPDLPPVPGKHSAVRRDHEYIRHGTLSLLAGIDLLSGEVLGLIRKRHRSVEFIEFLRLADAQYPAGTRIRVVLDNHSAHVSIRAPSWPRFRTALNLPLRRNTGPGSRNLGPESAPDSASTRLMSRSRFSASRSTYSRRCRRDCVWRSIPALFEPLLDRPPEPEDRPAAAVRSFAEPAVQWRFPSPG